MIRWFTRPLRWFCPRRLQDCSRGGSRTAQVTNQCFIEYGVGPTDWKNSPGLVPGLSGTCVSSGSRHSNNRACRLGAWCGVRRRHTTSASAVGQLGLARNRYRTPSHPHRTEQHHQTGQYRQPQQLPHLVPPLRAALRPQLCGQLVERAEGSFLSHLNLAR